MLRSLKEEVNLKRLLAGHAWKVVQKFIEREACFKIGDKGVDGNASAANDFTVDGYRKAFDFLFVWHECQLLVPLKRSVQHSELQQGRYVQALWSWRLRC